VNDIYRFRSDNAFRPYEGKIASSVVTAGRMNERNEHNKSLNATPKFWARLPTDSDQTVKAFADWARVNSMLYECKLAEFEKDS
jgi:hypothetical protein